MPAAPGLLMMTMVWLSAFDISFCHDVGVAAGRKRHDHVDGPAGIALRQRHRCDARDDRGAERPGGCGGEKADDGEPFHGTARGLRDRTRRSICGNSQVISPAPAQPNATPSCCSETP